MDHSPLGKLSAELRNEIYRLVLTAKTREIIIASGVEYEHADERGFQPPLTQVYKQIRNECLKMPYARNKAVVIVDDEEDIMSIAKASKWLKAVSTDLHRVVPRLVVRIDAWPEDFLPSSWGPYWLKWKAFAQQALHEGYDRGRLRFQVLLSNYEFETPEEARDHKKEIKFDFRHFAKLPGQLRVTGLRWLPQDDDWMKW